MRLYHYILVFALTFWFLGNVIFSENINNLKADCFIYIISIVVIFFAIFLDFRDEKNK